jgi:hypothetical protein
MTTKDIVFHHIRSTKGSVDLQLLTKEILRNDPYSKWDQSHWSFYRTQITSPNGRYTHLFSEEVKQNLKQATIERVERQDAPVKKSNSIPRQSKIGNDQWPVWDIPTDEEQLALAKVLLPYVKVLDPEIVALIAEDNNKNALNWIKHFEALNIRPDIYLWEASPVTFPGIRRHVGTSETAVFRSSPKLSKGENALYLDDNSYPKQLWSFALRNHRYGNFNPSNYSLAHILDHKDHKTRNISELEGYQTSADKNLFAGLYTSCANTVYIPTIFLKPTDHNSKVRLLLIQVVHRYYAQVCNILPHGLSFNLEAVADQWQLDNFRQPDIVGKVENTKTFLAFRNAVINKRIEELLKDSERTS